MRMHTQDPERNFLYATTAKSLEQFLRWNLVLVVLCLAMCLFFIVTKSYEVGSVLAIVGFFAFVTLMPQSGTFWYCGKAFRANMAFVGGYLVLRGFLVQMPFGSAVDSVMPLGMSLANIVIVVELLAVLLPLLMISSYVLREVRRPADYWS